ncbi:amino acid efflux transporter [Paenibacillus sp. UNCCL117]|uniref:APC family permease n=1 Tax=unclassified Paenibacillus TaxID=185978 RepID=UPI00088E9887|nr:MULTISPECIES: amino acid permease [unclassified Paenibacillus]SDD61573.1 amino acid/polyamine/organocation transporter, APC superfamily [Paenibacillus sp. cl123]SFW67528.1 amino acid efflux transporter [Paenibacillus sp. UNCCL117]
MMQKRTVTITQGVALYMGAVLGSGILILPGYTAQVAGPASILAWAILSLLSIPVAYTFARLALKYENYGGISTIVNAAFGDTWGAIVGWFFLVWVATGQAVVGLTGAAYIAAAFHWPPPVVYGIAFLLLAAALVSNLLGMRISGLVSLGLSGTVLILLVVTIAYSLPETTPNHFVPFAPFGVRGIGQACVLIFWAFFGWESITHLVPEFKRPHPDVMRSTWISVIVVGLVYTLLAVVTVGTGIYGSEADTAPLASLMNRALGVNAGLATAIIACIVCLGTLNVYLASSSRLALSLGADRKLPRWFSGTSANGTPYRSVLFLFITNALVLLFSYRFAYPVDKLLLLPTTLGILVYILASLACLKLLWHDPKGRWAAGISTALCVAIAPFSGGYLAVPLLTAACCLLYLYIAKRTSPLPADSDSPPEEA